MKKILFLIVAVAICGVSCKTTDDLGIEIFKFEGDWVGSYNGDDEGVLTIKIDSEGNLTGTGFSNNAQSEFTLSGTVSNSGILDASATSFGSTFTGNLVDSKGSGDWVNSTSSIGGKWVATKK